jgi:hypothetical protein
MDNPLIAFKTTVVSTEVVSTRVNIIALMNNGTLRIYNTPWGAPDDNKLLGWRWLTHEQLIELAREENRMRRQLAATKS